MYIEVWFPSSTGGGDAAGALPSPLPLPLLRGLIATRYLRNHQNLSALARGGPFYIVGPVFGQK